MRTGIVDQASVYTDLNAVRKLRGSNVDRDQAIRETARQFTSQMTHMMLKSMRTANAVFEEGNPLHSHGEQVFRDLFDHQLSLSMTSHRSNGLAEMLARQLGAAPVKEGRELNDDERFALDKVSRLRTNQPVLETIRQQLHPEWDQVLPEAAETTGTKADLEAPQDEPGKAPVRFESPEDFVASVYPAAVRVAEKLGVDPAVLVAQSALETGWGQHMIKGQNGEPSFNLFGIKADHRWQGESVDVWTTEYVNGRAVKEQAPFRAYNSFEESFDDYLGFIQDQSRYAGALAVADDPGQYPKALQAAGYATDPAYADKIQRIYQSDTVQRARIAWMAADSSGPRVPGGKE